MIKFNYYCKILQFVNTVQFSSDKMTMLVNIKNII